MPVWTVKEERKDWAVGCDEKPLRHMDEGCTVLVNVKAAGQTVEKHNNTAKLKEETERCPACWGAEGPPG